MLIYYTGTSNEQCSLNMSYTLASLRCLSIYLYSVYLSINLSIYLSIYLVGAEREPGKEHVQYLGEAAHRAADPRGQGHTPENPVGPPRGGVYSRKLSRPS